MTRTSICLMLVLSTAAGAQTITPADYAHAESLDRRALYGKVKNGLVIPHWIDGTDTFWYRGETASGYVVTLVDAATGRKQPAFDDAAMAQALATATGTHVTADSLPLDGLAFTKSRDSIRVTVADKVYACHVRPAQCDSGKPAPVGAPFELNFAVQVPPDLHAPNEGVVVSPDGRSGVLSKGGNLWLRDMATGQDKALTTDGEGPNYGYGVIPGAWKAASIPRERAVAKGYLLPPLETSWSPDSRMVLVPLVDQRNVADYPYVETAPGDSSFRPKLHEVRIALVGEHPATLEWFVIDIPTGTVRRLQFPYDKLLVLQQDLLAVRKTWWSADGRHLYAVAFGDNMEAAYFFDADPTTGAVRTVIEEHMTPRMDLNTTSYNPPNVRVTTNGKEVIWWSQRDGWGHLYLYDGQTGKLKNQITKGAWLVRDIIDVNETRRLIYFTGGGREGGNPYYRHLYRVSFDGTGLTLLSPEPADAMLTSPWNDVLSINGAQGYQVVSPSGKYVVYNYSTARTPTRTVIRATSNGHLVATVDTANASALFAAGYHPPEEFVAMAADGSTQLWSEVYWPHPLDSSRHYPIVDIEYASPLTAVVPHDFLRAINGVPAQSPSSEALAAMGFIVVAINGRGTTYRSRAFLHATYGKLNINGLDDHVAVMRQLGVRYPYADTTRVGIMGGSYGGWSAFRGMLEFPDFYKVGVAGSPPGSMHNMYNDYHWTAMQGRPVYSNGSQWRATPTEIARNYNATDGRQQAKNLKGHLLILMGELDENVVPGSPLQLIDALMKAHKDFDLIYMPNQNHVSGYGAYGWYTTRRIYDYFVRYLLGATPPDWNNIPGGMKPAS